MGNVCSNFFTLIACLDDMQAMPSVDLKTHRHLTNWETEMQYGMPQAFNLILWINGFMH